MDDQALFRLDPYNLESRGSPQHLDVGAMGITMGTAGIVLIACSICALLVIPAAMCYMAILTHRERRRWRNDEKKNAARFRAMERSRQARRMKQYSVNAARLKTERPRADEQRQEFRWREPRGQRESSSRAEPSGRAESHILSHSGSQ